MNRRRAVLSIASLGLAVGIAVPAIAYWQTSANTSVSAGAGALGTGATPTVSVSGRDVSVSWTASSLSASKYTIKRVQSGSGTPATVGSNCSGTVSAVTCTETGVAPGTWKYSVTPVLQGWTGTEGSLSAVATVGSASLSTSTATLTADGGSMTGTVSNYLDNENVTYCVDVNTTPCTAVGTGTVPATGGTKQSTLTIPAGLTVGSHTLYAIGSGGDVASKALAITVGAASKLVFTQDPAGAAPGSAFTTQPKVAVEDAENNVVTSSSATISLAIKNSTGTVGAALNGCTPTMSNGVATFSGCSIDKSGTGYQLTASSTNLASGNSGSFDVTAPLSITSPTANQSHVSTKAVITGTGADPNGGTLTLTFVPTTGTTVTKTATVSSDGTWKFDPGNGNTAYLDNAASYTLTATQGSKSASVSFST